MNRIFSREVGLPPHRYQIAVRVGRARELLAKGTPITRVARETGFADHSHLIRTFKRLVQVPRVDTFRKTARTFKTPRSLSAILQGTQGNVGATCPKETDRREEILGLPENRRTTGGESMSEPSEEGTHVALVTGANRGIGLEVARRLARRDYAVILGSGDPQKGERAAAKLAEEGLSDLPRQLDVSDNKSVEDLVARIVDDPGHLEVLVNNAAIHYDTWQRALGADLDIVREALETNTFGAWRTCEAFIPLLRGSAHGRIVNVSSGADSLASMGGGTPAYNVSKVALNALTRMLAAELRGTGILVNAVDQGRLQTWENTEVAPSKTAPQEWYGPPPSPTTVPRAVSSTTARPRPGKQNFARKEQELSELDDTVKRLGDEAEIRRVVDGIGLATDAKDWALCRRYFTGEIFTDFTPRSPAGNLAGCLPTTS